jgi:hypothetical protein
LVGGSPILALNLILTCTSIFASSNSILKL